MTLGDQAIAAAQAQRAKRRDDADRAEAARITKLREGWDNVWKYRLNGTTPPLPVEMVTGKATLEQGGRAREETAILFTIDDIRFAYVTTHRNEGIRVIAKCPDCGADRAYSFHGMEQLGEILQRGRGLWEHKCVLPVARSLAQSIRDAARQANVSTLEIVRQAEQQYDIINR